MGKHKLPKVGQRFKYKGVEWEIIEYGGCKNVVCKAVNGEQIIVVNNYIATYGDRDYRKDRKKRSPPTKVGDVFMTENHGRAIVLWKHDYKNMAIMFENTLEIRENVLAHVAFSGKVSDPAVGRISAANFNNYFYIGRVFENEYGVFSIKEVVDARKITICWDDGLEQVTSYDNIKYDRVNKTGVRLWNYLNVDINSHYVYFVHYKNEFVYIGSGTGSRYLHPKSGKSHNIDFNRIFFLENVEDLIISVPYQGLTKLQSESIERVLIDTHKPSFNRAIFVPY